MGLTLCAEGRERVYLRGRGKEGFAGRKTSEQRPEGGGGTIRLSEGDREDGQRKDPGAFQEQGRGR